ncbi:uncharacterized protein LOC123316242 [Coccinella septempunctata]|uniref:uncharacterized protein LOC123316242 n=1 Tax=Coccinella septempunctata TaxID=41139 RepID=UPI001D097DE1|nr:uncharacterized protein LOC123316242 [Coccinella septempunctata]
MEGDLIYYELKLQSLLEKFLETGYHIKNDVYFNRLLSFLGGKENRELADILLKLPLMTEWIVRAIKLWENAAQGPDHSISAFTLQLLGLVSKNENTFMELSKHDVYNRVISILQLKNPESLPSIKLGFIKVMTSIISHTSGLAWTIQTTYWQDILALSLQCQTVYIKKEGHLFIASFLDALLKHDLYMCSNIWQTLTTPLLTKPDDIFMIQENLFEVCDEKIEKFVGPTVSLMNDILEYFIEKILERDSPHVKNFKKIINIPTLVTAITNYLHMVRNQKTTYEIGRVWILLLYFSLVAEEKDGIIKPNIDKEFIEPIYSLLNIVLEGSKFLCISKFLFVVSVWWFKIKSKITVNYVIECDERYIFENQFLIPQLAHNYLFCRAVIYKHHFEPPTEARDDFVTNLFTLMSKNSIRWCYKWRDSLPSEEVAYNIGPKALSFVLQLKSVLNRDSAVLVFQSLLYVLVDINSILTKNIHLLPVFSKCEAYIKSFLETLTEFIVHFKISWRDSIESLCVFQASVEFLKIAEWPSTLVIADLNLIKVGINHYLSPSMALLIDQHHNCAIYILCSILKNKLHDPEWSVRDTALEVVSAFAEAARIEFQSFQKLLLNFELCPLVLNVALQDGESFVRASALKCLSRLVKIHAFWKDHLESQDIVKKIMVVLNCETEGIVRAQAATLLTTIFNYHDIETSVQKEIFTCMCSAAIDDLHWEVRLNCLSFWNDRVEQVLKHQGMVDGEFPKCTFSKETKKIVILTDVEIKRRIMRALDELSEMNCLTVLKQAISDDCDLQISKKGLEVSKVLVDLIEKYNIAENIILDEKGPPSNDSCYSSIVPSTPSPSCQNSDEVIEKILEVSDNSLLKDVYSPGNDYPMNIRQNKIGTRKNVTSAEFIISTKKNYKSLVSEREKWINSLDSLSSLLNDMLYNYELVDTNSMDCY